MHPLCALLDPLPTLIGPDEIKLQLRVLIRKYCHQRSSALALAITHYLEMLCTNAHHGLDESERCAYRQLAKHWRCLAWLDENRPPVWNEVCGNTASNATTWWP